MGTINSTIMPTIILLSILNLLKNYAPDLIIEEFFKERKQVGMLEKPLLENLFGN